MNEEKAYEQVAEEVARRDLKPGLWTKALAESVGNENIARSLYLKFRAQQLLSDHRLAEKHKAKQEFQAGVAAAKHRTASAIGRGFFIALATVCGLLSLLCGLGILGVLADSQNSPSAGGAIVCLVFALVFGFATVVCVRALDKQ
jgi:hypothetical protein